MTASLRHNNKQYFLVQGVGDDTTMNGISFTCKDSPDNVTFPGIWGDWEGQYLTCNSGFNGVTLKYETPVSSTMGFLTIKHPN